MKPVMFPSQLFSDSKPKLTFHKQPVKVNEKPKMEIKTQNVEDNNDLPLNETKQNETKQNETNSKAKPEDVVYDHLKDFIRNSENTFSAQKTDLVNLINDTLNEKHSCLRNQLEQLVDNKLNTLKSMNASSSNQGYNYNPEHIFLMAKALNNQSFQNDAVKTVVKPEIPEPVKEKIIPVSQPKKKGKYFPLPAESWRLAREKFPDLPETLASQAYIRDESKFIKIKSGYVELTESGVAKILASISK